MKKHLLFIFATLLPLLGSAHDFEFDGIYYNITSETDKTAMVTFKGNSSSSYDDESSLSAIKGVNQAFARLTPFFTPSNEELGVLCII
jgi:hypothetical protein